MSAAVKIAIRFVYEEKGVITVNSKMLKAAILSVSIVTAVSSSASVLLGSIQSDFPDVSKIKLQCFVTYPTIMVMIFTLIGGVLTAILGSKIVLMVGLVIFTVSGMMPMILHDFNAMLISRLCLGAGLGMVSFLSLELITDYYEGEERMVLVGQQFAIANVGQTASMLIAGYLAAFGWRKPFWIYSAGAIVFVFTLLFLPGKPPKKPANMKVEESTKSLPTGASKRYFKISCNWKIIVLAIMMFCYNATYLTVYSNLALIMKQESIGTATMVGYAMAFMTSSGMCVGMFFGKYSWGNQRRCGMRSFFNDDLCGQYVLYCSIVNHYGSRKFIACALWLLSCGQVCFQGGLIF